MEASRLRPARLEPGQVALVALLLALSLAAWLVTDDRMAGMDDGPGTDPGSLGFYTSAWVVMMAAMMFPSIAPMVRTYRLVQRRRQERRAELGSPATAAFVAGYLVTWSVFGVTAYALVSAVAALEIDALTWDRGGRWLAAAVIAAAAAYQLTPAKDACLTRCRSPLDFLMERWRDGAGGALRMGVEHGAWCVGCCWALMAALFALGVMSVGWMAFVAGLIAVEKLLPWKAVANRSIAVVLLVLAVGVAAAPESVPGLTVPGEHEMHMQDSM